MEDKLVKAISESGNYRIMVCNTTELTELARQKHQTLPTASAALGRTLAVAVLMAGNLKDPQEKISICIDGGGPLGRIMVRSYQDLRVKGFVTNSDVFLINEETGKLDVAQAVGKNGFLSVTRDLGLKQAFSGQVELVSGELGQDFAYYFNVSEQTPSLVGVGVLVDVDNSVKAAGALMVQILPTTQDEEINKLEEVARNLPAISSLFAENTDLVDIVKMVDPQAKIIGEGKPYFACECSKEKMLAALTTLDVADLQSMIDDYQGCKSHCQYCNTYYQVSAQELEAIIKEKA